MMVPDMEVGGSKRRGANGADGPVTEASREARHQAVVLHAFARKDLPRALKRCIRMLRLQAAGHWRTKGCSERHVRHGAPYDPRAGKSIIPRCLPERQSLHRT
jgi:hypothetical protein